MSTAGIIVIGNEILSGKVKEVNAAYLTEELRALGVDVRRVVVIPDERDIIAEEVRAFSQRYDHVFTSGGVGPTHDDVTIAGIAQGVDRPVVRHPDLEKGIKTFFGDQTGPSHLKMSEIPEGAELIVSGHFAFPVVHYQNIYIFPGIPNALRHKFKAIKERFRDAPFYGRRIYLDTWEENIAEDLHAALEVHPELQLGSYPCLDKEGWRVLLTLEHRNPDYLQRAFDDLMGRLDEKIVFKTEAIE